MKEKSLRLLAKQYEVKSKSEFQVNLSEIL